MDEVSQTATQATDPVCGMSVDPAKGKPTVEHAGQTYHFCCQGCADKFAADPELFDMTRRLWVDRKSTRLNSSHAD